MRDAGRVPEDIAIQSLLHSPIDVSRPHLNPDRVSWYVRHFDQVEPVTVFRLDEGLLLADGHHRLAAASSSAVRRSRLTSDAGPGTMPDLRHRIAGDQRGITEAEAMDVIQRHRRET